MSVFICNVCGGETPKWQGQCPHCDAWNTLGERKALARHGGSRVKVAPGAPPRALGEGVAEVTERLNTGQAELDRVLGGGLVKGSVSLLGGDPGIGKSTLLLQVAAHAAAHGFSGSAGCNVLYASGEESVPQIGLRARRLGLAAERLRLIAETDLEAVTAQAAAQDAAVLIVDSIQTMQTSASASSAGAVSQLRECTAELVRFAKSTGTAVVIVGHVTKEGTIAGPRVLEHLVDTVLYFESEVSSRYRIVRATKNRFGSAGELGFFAMSEMGLREVRNPAAIFLARGPEPAAGSIVTVAREGGRALLIELQALVDRMRFGAPRRIAQGLDANRVAMLLAVMHRHAGLSLQEHDVFVNVVGGMQIVETSSDLPVVLALASSLKDRTLERPLVAFGEIGLTGEVRPVAYGEERLREAQKQGFRRAIIARDNAPRRPLEGLAVHAVARVADALAAAMA
ncbi:MAG: DNA repair protein RadA [Steroidobacteraceae bacterium]